ncbi:hypothetical protein [Blastococcus colisei]|uniref:hypothetical protein n=1 Tax=Blastococcus colisei TaxID=1564162 RepID=UPI001B87B21C|nr:hypothetical protein [Blastococcus colisei]
MTQTQPGKDMGAAMDVHDLVTATRDALTVRRVFGEALERDGVTVIPAAVLRGGVGGGGGQDEQGQRGEGGGFGLVARPAGAYVIRDGAVTWHPAFDLNRTIGLAAAVAVAWLFTVGRRSGGPGGQTR